VKRTVSTNPKRVSRPSRALHSSDIFRNFGCVEVAYTVDVPLAEFDLEGFYKATGISPKYSSWSAILTAKKQSSGYHVHFDGKVNTKERLVRLHFKYYDGALKPRAGETEPYSESLMPWIGTFFDEKNWRAAVNVRFEKSTEKWRGKFNLPFKVTMADTEVTIDGVSLSLPANSFGAVAGWLSRIGKNLTAAVMLFRNIDFEKFSIENDIVVFNNAIKVYTEEIRP